MIETGVEIDQGKDRTVRFGCSILFLDSLESKEKKLRKMAERTIENERNTIITRKEALAMSLKIVKKRRKSDRTNYDDEDER